MKQDNKKERHLAPLRQMRLSRVIPILGICIALLACVAAAAGIFWESGPGPSTYQSIRGRVVPIYGKGLYQHMSAEVAPQGIAQDYITLFLGVPVLLIALWKGLQGSKRGQFLLAGTLGYFFVTYLFYTVMGMYNGFFLVYVALMGASFYALLLTLLSFDVRLLKAYFSPPVPVGWTGGFLLFNAAVISLQWLSIVVPPLLDGTIIPVQVEHYTTLIVQGLDLGILLPAAAISAMLWLKQKPLGFLLAPVYYVFLSLIMSALTAKVLAMLLLGYNVIPVIFIIPLFNIITIAGAVAILKSIRSTPYILQIKHYEKATSL